MIVVRVKRHREDEPADTICLVERESDPIASTKKRKKLNELSLSEKKKPSHDDPIPPLAAGKVFLKRISTIDSCHVPNTDTIDEKRMNRNYLDDETLSILNKRPQPSNTATNIEQNQADPVDHSQRKRVKVIVPRQKRTVLGSSASSDPYVLVDMTQLYQHPNPPDPPASVTDSAVKSKAKILDPATRSLRQGILTALQRNDFNEISSSLLKGGDGNYQLEAENGGYTALMVAAMKGNWRMLKRLLLNGVNPLLRDKEGLTALDLLKPPSRSTLKEYNEVRDLLQSAMRKAMSTPSVIRREESQFSDEQFVYDVYCLDPSSSNSSQRGDNSSHNTGTDQTTTTTTNYSSSAVVAVEGLKILEDGQVELLSYDSDWSDLADDEDPDSNDERFPGNDYPDEDSDDHDGGRRYFSDNNSYSSEEERDRVSHRRYRQSNAAVTIQPTTRSLPIHSNRNNNPARDPYLTESYSSRKQSSKTQRRRRDENPNNDWENDGELDLEDLEDENRAIDRELAEMLTDHDRTEGNSLFDRNLSIGRVLRPHLMEGNYNSYSGSNSRHLESEEIREIWQEDIEEEDSHHTQLAPHAQRVYAMRERTNMLFASNPKEFDSRGMPLFGGELSEDEANYWSDTDEKEHLPKDTIAYDSELDRDSD